MFYSFGVVVAFATNSYLHQGVENATSSSRLAVQDSQRFLKTTSSEANHLLNQNYDELIKHLTTMLQGKYCLLLELRICGNILFI